LRPVTTIAGASGVSRAALAVGTLAVATVAARPVVARSQCLDDRVERVAEEFEPFGLLALALRR
jgi:hypothetical protein